MSLLGSAVLVNWGGIVQEKEADYNQWHSLEHMPERISLPIISIAAFTFVFLLILYI